MDIPRGHAMLPLTEPDFLDFIHNYFKAEYAPIRSFWATATAEPRQPMRWINMGHELTPLTYRPANAQAQKDLESLDYFIRKWNLDAEFARGIVIRFSKYEIHERLEKRLYESSRLDLMVRKALKEKHMIDALWPSPAPRNLAQELLQQGVKVRQWYGDMFGKYFKKLHSVDDFVLRAEVDAKIKASQTLMLVPFVDHLVFGAVDPIMPIIAQGAGYTNAKAWKQKGRGGNSFGEPDRFEIRFDAPSEVEDTQTRTVVRQCQCLKCGTKRDVTVVISIDPNPGPIMKKETGQSRGAPNPTASASRSKASQRYSPGYQMPNSGEPTQQQPLATQDTSEGTPSSPEQKKQCPKCTFLNHPDLTACEMCQGDLPASTIPKPPSPGPKKPKSKISHAPSGSLPPPVSSNMRPNRESLDRPPPPNRHSLSSSLFSIFPFNQQQQSEHHPNLPPAQEAQKTVTNQPQVLAQPDTRVQPSPDYQHRKAASSTSSTTYPRLPTSIHSLEQDSQPENELRPERPSTPPISHIPQMAMMPMTPPSTGIQSSHKYPTGLPQNLMDDYVPVSPAFPGEEAGEEAGWGEISRENPKTTNLVDREEDEDNDEAGREGLIDLDEVAREEMGVWGQNEEE